MDNPNYSRNLIMGCILAISIILFIISTISLTHTFSMINELRNLDDGYVEKCVKYPLFAELAMITFNLFLSIFMMSISLLTLLNIQGSNFYNSMYSFLYSFFFYSVGFFLISITISGFVYWNQILTICNIDNTTSSNIFLGIIIVFEFIIALFLVLVYSTINVMHFQINSLKRNEGGSSLARKLFWWLAFKERNEVIDNEIIRSERERNLNLNNHNGNNNNNSVLNQNNNRLEAENNNQEIELESQDKNKDKDKLIIEKQSKLKDEINEEELKQKRLAFYSNNNP